MADNPYVLDIETNALLAGMLDFSSLPYKLISDARLWCVVIRSVNTDEVFTAAKEEVTKEWMQETLKDCTHLITHNGLKFDAICLLLFQVMEYRIGYLGEPDTLFGKPVVHVDTLILSRLINPDRFGGHSLGAWGERLGRHKTDFRQLCIDKGYIEKNAPKGAEFRQYVPEMLDYCITDTAVGKDVFVALMREMGGYAGWTQAIKQENKLADLAIRRESFGFWFDKELALKHLDDLTQKMQVLTDTVNPLLPPKPMGKTDLKNFTPPATQFLKNGKPSSHIVKFAERTGGSVEQQMDGDVVSGYFLKYEVAGEKVRYKLPFTLPIKTHVPADIGNLDHVKMHLLDLGWEPTEWAERDLTKDSKKLNLTYEKRIAALTRWASGTFEGKYKQQRLEIVGYKSYDSLIENLSRRLEEDRPVRVPTAPKIRVGVEKELCPNLTSLGDKVGFAKDFALFLTYRHRKSCIAGGDLEDVDYEDEYPNTGYLSMYREADGRVSTPAIEIGAVSNRYRHIGIANVARNSSIYGEEMRRLFGCGDNFIQFGFDYASLENRVQGGYVKKYAGGEELAVTLMAEKPFDLHSINAQKLGLPRTEAKSVGYMLLYGGAPPKVKKMLGVSEERSKEIYNDFWNAVPALKELRDNVEKFWRENGETYVPGIDRRKINIRSKHSLLNFLFQSCGVICAKYTTVFLAEELEKQGYCIDVFAGKPDVAEMISYHDESQMAMSPQLASFKTFKTKEEATDFVTNWEGSQLSAISEGLNGWYVALPNPVSLALEKAARKTEQLLKLDFVLGFEWIINKTWAGCH